MPNLRLAIIVLAAVSAIAATDTASVRGRGPVGVQCSGEIDRYCPALRHGAGAMRACLQNHRRRLSRSCKAALDYTGGGRRWR